MLDRYALRLLHPPVTRGAALLRRWGVRADSVTLIGLALGLAAAGAIAQQAFWLGAGLILLSRLADGLDGALARLGRPTDRGAFLDIACDFVFYASIPLSFALADPVRNALPAAVLLAAFIGTGTSFLAYALLAERRGLTSAAYPSKGFFYLGGLTEGTETIACFVVMAARPTWFAPLAYGFAALCGLTLLTRLWAGWQGFAEQAHDGHDADANDDAQAPNDVPP